MVYEDDTVLSDWSLLSVIISGRCYGCTQVFSKELFSLLQCRQPSDEFLQMRLHDTWVSISAAATGRIIFDRESHIRYRRHGNNYTKLESGVIEIWRNRLLKLIHAEKRNPRSKSAREVLECYPEYVEKDPDRDLIHILASPKTIPNRAALIKYRERILSVSGETVAWYVIKVLAGWV